MAKHLTCTEAADRFGISSAKIRELINDGEVDAVWVDHHWEITPRGLRSLKRYSEDLGRITGDGKMIQKVHSGRTAEVEHLFVNLRMMCENRGAKTALAELAAVSRPYLHRVIEGQQDPSISVVGRIAAAVGVEIGDLCVDPEQFPVVLSQIRRSGKLPGDGARGTS